MELMTSKNFSPNYPYEEGIVNSTPLIPNGNIAVFDNDIAQEIEYNSFWANDWFCREIANPLKHAIQAYKLNRINIAQDLIASMPQLSDWRQAAYQWLERRTNVK